MINEFPQPLSNIPNTGTDSSGSSPNFYTLAFAPKLRSTPACSFTGPPEDGVLDIDGDFGRIIGWAALGLFGDLLPVPAISVPLPFDLLGLSCVHSRYSRHVDKQFRHVRFSLQS